MPYCIILCCVPFFELIKQINLQWLLSSGEPSFVTVRSNGQNAANKRRSTVEKVTKRVFMMRGMLLAILTFVIVSESKAGPFESKGWRLPTDSELSQKWRSADKNRFARISIDLNGDLVRDFAGLYISKDGKKRVALIVFISQKNGTFKKYFLDEKEYPYIDVLGVAIVKPGKYLTPCGRFSECEEGDVKNLVVKYGAVDFFKTDSDAKTYFYWDERTSAMQYVSMGD